MPILPREEPEKPWVLQRAKRKPKPRTLKAKPGMYIPGPSVVWKGHDKRGGNAFRHTHTGRREDLGLTVRSNWEANFLRILKRYGIKYEYEPSVFYYPIKRGNKAYTPDIWLPTTDEWVEIKGWLDKNSEIKLKRFKRYYPDEFSRLTMVIGQSKKTREFCEQLEVPYVLGYEKLSRLFKDEIKEWEGR